MSVNVPLSIVVATYARSALLKALIESLTQQTDMAFEVVVAIDGSPDDTEAMLEAYRSQSPFEIRWLNTNMVDAYGLATARNAGIKAARGTAVVILDDDSIPVPEFVAEHKATVTVRTLTGGARISTETTDNLAEKNRLYLEIFGDSCPGAIVSIRGHGSIVENNTCMFKSDWLGSGLFDESIQWYGGIGQNFMHRLQSAGYQYQFNPRAAIIHQAEYRRNHLYPKAPASGRKSVMRRLWNRLRRTKTLSER